jgi:hypothetical protein
MRKHNSIEFLEMMLQEVGKLLKWIHTKGKKLFKRGSA